MNKHATALAGLITAASIATGTAVAAQAHPSHLQMHTNAHQTSKVAVARLHTLMGTHVTISGRTELPNDGGMPTH